MRLILAQLTDFPEAGRIDIYEYSKALARLGHDVQVIVCADKADRPLPDGLAVHALGISTAAGPSNSLRFASLALQKIQVLHREKPADIVHLFNPAPATYFLGWRLKRMKKRPKILYDVRTGGIGSGFDSRLINGMAKTAPLFADGIVTLSSSLFTRLFKARIVRHAVIPLGVDNARYGAAKLAKKGGSSFVYLGSLGSNRRLSVMLEAFASVAAAHPDARLTLIGTGDQAENLKELSKKLGLEKYVTFTGGVPFEQVPGFLAAADIGLSFVPITSWFNPQPPLKTLEYLASGLPVVATATDSHRELWQVLPPELLRADTAEDFAEGMEFALAHISTLTPPEFQAAAAPFDWSAIVRDKLVPFYEELASR